MGEAGILRAAASAAAIPRRLAPVVVKIMSDIAVVATFRSTADAQVAQGILDEVGIESMIRSDNAGGMYPALSHADLMVRIEDVDSAYQALNRSRQDSARED